MKTLVIRIALLTALFVAAPFHAAFAQLAPTPFTSQNFAVLAGTTVTNTGPTLINTGDLGVHPGSAVTGFPPGIVVVGTQHVADAVALGAKVDLIDAYDQLDGQPCDTTFSGGADLVGLTLVSGVYCSASSLFLSGTLTLDAQFDPDAVWVFQTESTLISASASVVRIINGGQNCNVYWKVGSSATLGTGSTFIGNILALTSISLQTAATVKGRALARNGAVTMDTNTVGFTACSNIIVAGDTDTPGLSLSKTADPITYTTVGQEIVYTYILKNTGGTTLTGPFTVTDDKLGSFTCGSTSTLAPGATLTCTRSYTIQASDLGDESSLPQGVTANIDTGSWLSFKNSTQDTKITGAGPGVPNGTYRCWCIQDYVPADLHNQPAQLYSTAGAGLPADVAALAWGKVNYTLNHKIRGAGRSNLGFLKDVQTAIWVLLGETNPEWGVSATAQQMINAANANANFAPASGDVVAVLVYSDGIAAQRRSGEIQESICEMNSKLKRIVNTATGSGGGVTTGQAGPVTVIQVKPPQE